MKTSNVDKHSIDGEPEVRLCNYVDVYKNEDITDDLDFMKATATPAQIRTFSLARGDSVITKDSETADDVGVPAFVKDQSADLLCGYHLAIVRPESELVVDRFLFWTLNSKPVLTQWTLAATGVTRVGIKSTDLRKAVVPVPPLREQRAIADFLDRETARIDTLIEKQEKLIETLRERQTAEISQLADDNSDLVPFGRYIVKLRQGSSPQCDATPADGVEQWGVLKTGCMNHGVFNPEENKLLPECEPKAIGDAAKPGELVVSRGSSRELVGSAAVVPKGFPKLLLSDLTYGIMLNVRVRPDFAVYAFRSDRVRASLEAMAKGSSPSMQKLSQRDLKELMIWIPDRCSQEEIVRKLSASSTRINHLISKAQRFIELAKERRSALITAAVTGQIEVGKFAVG